MSPEYMIRKLLRDYPSTAHARRWWKMKADGTRRPIAAPNRDLQKWLKTMNNALNVCYGDWPSFMHGGIQGRSYISFAAEHVNKACLLTVDIRRCFDSIGEKQIAPCFERILNINNTVASELAGRLVFEGRIGQGFPTSNFVSNLYLIEPLIIINDEMNAMGLTFGNYVDDLAVSGDITDPGQIINKIAKQLSRKGFAINKKSEKIRVMKASGPQVLCGLQVNKHLTLTKPKKLELLGAVIHGSISSPSLQGWLANIKQIDPAFYRKLERLSRTRGLIS